MANKTASNTKNSEKTKTKKTNETKQLYYQSPATERKVSLTTTIIIGAITLAAGLGIGLNWDNLTTQFSPYLGGKKTAETVDFSALNSVYEKLAESYDGDLDKTKIIEEAKRGLVNAAGDK